jgi:sporulation protein YlmC with PRC-barrel domain
MSHAGFEKLNDTRLELDDTREDIRGRTVIDQLGVRVGHVSNLFVDNDERKVRMLEVKAGGFLGFGERHVLIPVETVARVEKHVVRVDQTREHVLNSPAYDPNLIPADATGYWEPFYGYYDLPPHRGYLDSSVPLTRAQEPTVHVPSSLHDRDL